jgi:hypothetical protein
MIEKNKMNQPYLSNMNQTANHRLSPGGNCGFNIMSLKLSNFAIIKV